MRKISYLLALSFGLMLFGCAQKPAEKEVIVVPETPIVIEKTNTVVIEKDEPAKSTTIVLDKNGVKVKATEVDVEVKK